MPCQYMNSEMFGFQQHIMHTTKTKQKIHVYHGFRYDQNLQNSQILKASQNIYWNIVNILKHSQNINRNFVKY